MYLCACNTIKYNGIIIVCIYMCVCLCVCAYPYTYLWNLMDMVNIAQSSIKP